MAKSDYQGKKKPFDRTSKPGGKKSFHKSKNSKRNSQGKTPSNPDLIRLNKFIANSGVCSRREADTFYCCWQCYR